MESLFQQTLREFPAPDRFSDYSLDISDQAIDLSIKSFTPDVTFSLNSTFTSVQDSLNTTNVEDNRASFPPFVEIDIEGDNMEDAEESGEISELRKSLPQLNELVELHRKVGQGTFSSVYLATLRRNPQVRLAVKHLTPFCHPSRIARELKCLRDIGGEDNVSELLLCLRHEGCVAFIMHYQPHQTFRDYVLDMDTEETQLYMKNLFIALKRVHSFGIIHRDVKPGNFLYDRQTKKFMLVDFGLAQSVDSSSLKNNSSENDKSGTLKCERSESTPLNNSHVLKKRALSVQSGNSIIVPFKAPADKQCPYQFQVLAPGESKVKQMPCFVRVQNSRVKMRSSPMQQGCVCFGKNQTCEICCKYSKLVAPRAGTPGFRPPEVLLKSLNQTTAVDMWACGVMLLSILSGCYPFFKSPDDMTALAEIMTIFGTKAVKEQAAKLKRLLSTDVERCPLDLKKLCVKLRSNRIALQADKGVEKREHGLKCPSCGPSISTNLDADFPCLCPTDPFSSPTQQFPDEAYDLLNKLLDLNPDTRISAEDALKHPFVQ